ncbi:hypothetical protein J5N97_011594 [Dioscorea zingiberensis]|uniref:Uncharacterized protein n=1 Tax=Dioscorea zingiberensis TaxID=325984 RepID=A0A9D5D2B9_9LILI|nr:hypothetical protein J5N97_011594 [Dioscorea zingiberensis]
MVLLASPFPQANGTNTTTPTVEGEGNKNNTGGGGCQKKFLIILIQSRSQMLSQFYLIYQLLEMRQQTSLKRINLDKVALVQFTREYCMMEEK